jgi:hypothetical protein
MLQGHPLTYVDVRRESQMRREVTIQYPNVENAPMDVGHSSSKQDMLSSRANARLTFHFS